MKNITYILVAGLLLVGCTGVKTISKGLENNSYLEFIGDPGNYTGGVEVVIDDIITFKAEVNKPYAKKPKGNVYAISSGKHIISVSYNNKVLYLKQVFISAQETKQINLP